MGSKEKLSQSYKKFCLAEGSQHIASEYAILKLQELISKFEIKDVLEVGLGIGSIAGSLLAVNEELSYTGTEANEFCLESLPQNLEKNYERLRLFPDLGAVPKDTGFNLVIIDGRDAELKNLKQLFAPGGIIVLEGDRLEQQELIREIFPSHRMVHAISLRKNNSYSPFPAKEWQGGLKIIFTNPSWKQHVWWIKEKLLTKIKYQYPGRHFGSRKKKRENTFKIC